MTHTLTKAVFITSFLLLSPLTAFSAPQHATATISPGTADGAQGNISFHYGFKNCFGNISLAFGKESIQTQSYQYEGKSYSPSDLGQTEFKKVSAKGSNITADVYAGNQKLGSAEFKNVIFFAEIGCFSETYSVIEMLGLNNSEFKKRIEELRLDNIRVSSPLRSYKTEELIIKKIASEKQLAKQEKAASAATNSPPPQSTGTTAPTQQKVTAQPSPAPAKAVNYEKITQATQEQKLKDEAATQKAAEGLSDAASGFSKGISGTGEGVGLSLMIDNADDPDSPFTPLFLGMVFGKVQDPTLPENTQGLLSGASFQAAFNMEWLEEPSTYSTDKYKKNNRRWDLILEAKLYGNITATEIFQPYIGLGYASYTDYNRRNAKIGDGWTFVKSVGLSVVGSGGVFSIGVNTDMKVLDISFFTHM